MITYSFTRSQVVCQASLACLICMIMLIITPVFAQQGSNEPGLHYTLIPPGNCHAENVECGAYLTWNIPDSSSNPPPGLMGYYVYRNGNLLDIISDPDTNFSYDFGDPDTIIYSVTARYDLTPYGFPGQFGESDACVMDTIILDCYLLFPFYEDWNQGSFAYNDWKFISGQGNWIIEPNIGKPLPAAAFKGLPGQTDYSFMFRSPMFKGAPYSCVQMDFNFMFKLEDIAASGTEWLEAGVLIEDTVSAKLSFPNNGSSDWGGGMIGYMHIPRHDFAIYFKAYGSNSANINRWLLDNISVTIICQPIKDFSNSLTGNIVNLQWDHPCDTLLIQGSGMAGFNIFRTDQTGEPPFTKINSEVIVVQQYTDTLPTVEQNAQYRYFVTTVFIDNQGMTLCEPAGDTILVIPASGVGSEAGGSFTLSPNPGKGLFTLKTAKAFGYFEVFNIQGLRVLQAAIPKGQDVLTIDLTRQPCGVYFLRIETATGVIVSKIFKI